MFASTSKMLVQRRLASTLLQSRSATASSSHAFVRSYASSSSSSSSKDASTGVDPGYVRNAESREQEEHQPPQRPSSINDPFPLPFDPRLQGLSLSSEHQSEGLHDSTNPAIDPVPLRVPGREPGQESREVKIARLIWQTRKRGTLEADLLLSTFAQKELKQLSDEEIQEFDTLLDEPDWDIFYWMTDRKPVVERWKASFATEGRLGWRMRKHARNDERQMRTMPNLEMSS